MTFGDYIKEIRIKAGYNSQVQFADAMGCTERTISRWENNENPMSDKYLTEIAIICKADLNRLRQLNYKLLLSKSEKKSAFKQLSERIKDSTREIDVTSLSAHNIDWIHLVDGVAINDETTVDESKETAGGSGANTSSTLAQLRLRVACLGICTNDKNGRFLIDRLKSVGVDTDNIHIVNDENSNSGNTSIYTDFKGHRTIFIHKSINDSFTKIYKSDELCSRFSQPIKNSKVIHLSSFQESEINDIQKKIARRLSEDQILTFTPGALQAKYGVKRLLPILQRTNLLFLDIHQLRTILKTEYTDIRKDTDISDLISKFFDWRKSEKFTEPFILTVITPKNLRKSVSETGYIAIGDCYDKKTPILTTEHLNIPNVKRKIRDATGAGDNTAAGIISGLFHKDSIDKSAERAYKLAVMVAGQLGGRLPEDIDLDSL